MADVPNTEGYRLLGILKSNGLAVPLVVQKDGKGCHCLYDSLGWHWVPSLFTGWLADEEKTTTIETLSQFCEASRLNPKLIRAVVRQMGGWEDFKQSAPDICRGGIDGGFSGFIYNADTEPFARRNRQLIAEMAQAQADDFGTSVTEMIQGFGCFRHDSQKPTDAEIGSALYAGKDINDASILNALAWYAGEEVSRSYCDLTGND